MVGRIRVEADAIAGLIKAGDLLLDAVLRTPESFVRLLLSTEEMTGFVVEVLLVVTILGRIKGG